MRGKAWTGAALAAAMIYAIVAALALCACGPPEALRYVVPDDDDVIAAPPPAPEDEEEKVWPIYDGTAPEDCGVGLIGEACERGLLADEIPLEEREHLGPDGLVFEGAPPGPRTVHAERERGEPDAKEDEAKAQSDRAPKR